MREMEKTDVAFTIVNDAYMHFAIKLALSFVEFHQSSLFYIYNLDGKTETGHELERIFVVGVDERIIPDIMNRAFYYEITELSTSIKPNIMLHLLREGYKSVTYVDPDICFYSHMDAVYSALKEFSIILTPHRTEPIYDEYIPNDTNFLRAGAYNLGFIAVSQQAEAYKFLEWWQDRLTFKSLNAFSAGLFTDQKWIDLVPSYFTEVLILKDDCYNVAYWNLDNREILKEFGNYFVNDKRLVFFHFSGIELDGNSVSKYSNRHETIYQRNIDIKLLFDEYRHDTLILRERLHSFSSSVYRYSRFLDGYEITNLERMLYLHHFAQNIDSTNPFSLKRREFYHVLEGRSSRRNSVGLQVDPAMRGLGIKISKSKNIVKHPFIFFAKFSFLSKMMMLFNNSLNKVNFSWIIYNLIKNQSQNFEKEREIR